MKRIRKKIIAITAFAVALFVIFSAIPMNRTRVNAIDTSVEAEEALRDKIKDLQGKQDELEADIQASKSEQLETEQKLEYLNSLIFTTNEEIVATETLIEEFTQLLEDTQAQIEATKLQLEENFESLKLRLNYSYVEGDASYLEMLLDSKSFVEFLTSAERVGYMLESDRILLEETEAALEQLEVQEATYDSALEEQKALKVDLEAVVAESELLTEEANAYIAQLEEEQAELEEDYEALIAMEEEFNAEIEAILAARIPPPSSSGSNGANYAPEFGGTFIKPLPGGTYYVSSEYGWRTLWGYQNFHLGIDLAAPAGTPVYASAAGTVVTSAYHYSYGYYVLIDHGDGFATLYAHNSALYVNSGSYVAQGQKIAAVGTTGSSSGNHLHFEVRVNGSTTNPRSYVGF
ncbi:MAG: peptidoglycan DD-metalloendopeptidase family protein [Clostridia bacterium]|nr:peptidoglycan DD-metalloendopeptidase family protein [Clostridia bacterium]